MATQAFAYTALDGAGQRKAGVVEAEDKDAAVARLTAEGRFVLEIKPHQASAAQTVSSMAKGRAPSREDVALFTRRMADMATAGLPLDRVLNVVAEQAENATLRAVAEEALNEVRAGTPVSQALAKHPKLFPVVYTQTLRAGEASGQFPQVASRLADFQEKEVTRRSQITSALVYPGILAGTAVAVVIFMLTFVVPRLSGVFKDLGDDLPITTKILLASTDFMTTNWVLIIVGLVAAFVGIRAYLATEAGAYQRDRFLLNAPIIGPVITKATISRFARVLGTLVYGGVPILEALEIAGLSAGNRVFTRSAEAVEEEVRAGRPIAEAMRDTGAFPPVLNHMVAIGEETGDLPKMLERVSDSLDFEVDTGMRRLVTMVEPAIVLTMAIYIGFIVVSVMLPIFQAQETIK